MVGVDTIPVGAKDVKRKGTTSEGTEIDVWKDVVREEPQAQKSQNPIQVGGTGQAQESSVVVISLGKLKKYFYDENGKRRLFKVTFINENGEEVDSVRIPVNEFEKRLQEYGFYETTIRDIKKAINSDEVLKKEIEEGKVQEFEVSSKDGELVLTPILVKSKQAQEAPALRGETSQTTAEDNVKKGVIARIKEFLRKYGVFLEPGIGLLIGATLIAAADYLGAFGTVGVIATAVGVTAVGGGIFIISLWMIPELIKKVEKVMNERKEKAKNGNESGGSSEKGKGNENKSSISKTLGKAVENLNSLATSTTNFVTEKLGSAKEHLTNFATSNFKRIISYFPKRRKKKGTSGSEDDESTEFYG